MFRLVAVKMCQGCKRHEDTIKFKAYQAFKITRTTMDACEWYLTVCDGCFPSIAGLCLVKWVMIENQYIYIYFIMFYSILYIFLCLHKYEEVR